MLEKIVKKLFNKSLIGIAFLAGLYGCGGQISKSTTDTDDYDTEKGDIISQYNEKDALTYKETYYDLCEKKTFFLDQDGDGFGIKGENIQSCIQPLGYVENWKDCDDNNYFVNPIVKEICNGIDDNCNGQIDEGFPLSTWYEDKDGDGFGNINDKGGSFCEPPEGYVQNNKDCDDSDYNTNPTVTEICDNKDNNCDGEIDKTLIKDCSTACGTGKQICQDGKWEECDAPKPQIEVCDEIDNDCDEEIDEGLEKTKWYQDNDEDGFGNPDFFDFFCGQPIGYVNNTKDCDDSNQNVNPTMEEICNGIDDNCDGLVDLKYNDNNCVAVAYDFIFVIDNSGSMNWNDPKNMRYKGLENVVKNIWNPIDRGIIIPFATTYQVISPFTSEIENPDLSINSLLEYIETAKIASVGSGTNIGPAVQEGIKQFESNEQKRVIILLTDGETGDSISPSLLNSDANSNMIEICALGFGNANDSYLTSLTNNIGDYIFISNAEQIPMFFQESYISLKCQNWLKCSEDGEWVTKTGKCGVEE